MVKKIVPKVPSPPPIPSERTRYPFEDLKVGQSFFDSETTPGAIMVAIVRYQRKLNRKFTARVDVYNGIPGIRVWRLK